VFNISLVLSGNYKVAYLKWSVKENYKVAEEIAKYSLCSKSNGNTTDTKSGNYGGDLETKIIQQENKPNNPDKNL
jgi:hypothetical protein